MRLHCLEYSITTLSPVLITIDVGEVNTVNTRDFINGGTICGALANQFIKKKMLKEDAHLDDTFCRFFLSGELKFLNAYISDKYYGNIHFPTPLSLRKEKNDRPIRGRSGNTADLLWLEPGDLEDTETRNIDAYVTIDDSHLRICPVKKSLNFHHTRDRETGTTKKGAIFNYESIDPQQEFKGYILGNDEILKEFLKFVKEEKLEQEFFFLGRSRSAQYGKTKIKINSSEPEPFFSEVSKFTPELIDWEEGEISMTLLSDLILYNENGFSTTDINSLKEYLNLDIVKEKSFIKTGTIETYVSIWHLRKPSETCFKAGSTFLLEIPENKQKSIKERLLKLQEEGIGQRRHEGFGRVVFGWQKNEDYWPIDVEKEAIEKYKDSHIFSKPQYPIPPHAAGKIKVIITDFIHRKIALEAARKADEFIEHPPSKSLLNRLENMTNSLNYNDFIKKIHQLAKTAREKLNQSRTTSETLEDFLVKEYKKIDIHKLLTSEVSTKLKELAVLIDFDLERIDEEKIYRLYFSTFFNIMRKQQKGDRGGK
jgi:CRISPR-associated protein Csx10